MWVKKLAGVLVSVCFSVAAWAEVDHHGLYVGGGAGKVKWAGEYAKGVHLYQTTQNLEGGVGAGSVYWGFNFNRIIGLEMDMFVTRDMAETNRYEAQLVQINVGPRVYLPIGERFALSFKMAVAGNAYGETWRRSTTNNGEKKLFWSGGSMTFGLGAHYAVTNNIHLRMTYDMSNPERNLRPAEDDVDNGSGGFWQQPQLDLEIRKAMVGMHYQF